VKNKYKAFSKIVLRKSRLAAKKGSWGGRRKKRDFPLLVDEPDRESSRWPAGRKTDRGTQ